MNMMISRDDLPKSVTDRDTLGGRYKTPMGDQRERAVPCSERRVPECEKTTFALDTVCDFCAMAKILSKISSND